MDYKILIIYLIIFVSNIFINANFYFNSRKTPEYKYTLLFWFFLFLNFLFQGFLDFNNQILGISIAICGGIYYYLLKLYKTLLRKEENKFDLFFMLFFIFIGILLSFFVSFKIFTLVIVFGSTFPLILFFIKNFKEIKEMSLLLKLSVIAVMSSALHMYSYPFLRLNKENSEFGFFLAFIIVILLNLVSYYLSDFIYIKSIEDKLKESIEEKNKNSQSLIIMDLMNSFNHEINNALQLAYTSNDILIEKNKNLDIKLNKNIKVGLDKIQSMFYLFNEAKRQDSISKEKLIDLFTETLSFVNYQLNNNSKSQILFDKNIFDDADCLLTSKGFFVQILVSIINKISLSCEENIQVDFCKKEKVLKIICDSRIKEINLDYISILSNKLNFNIILEDKQIKIDLKNIHLTDTDLQ